MVWSFILTVSILSCVQCYVSDTLKVSKPKKNFLSVEFYVVGHDLPDVHCSAVPIIPAINGSGHSKTAKTQVLLTSAQCVTYYERNSTVKSAYQHFLDLSVFLIEYDKMDRGIKKTKLPTDRIVVDSAFIRSLFDGAPVINEDLALIILEKPLERIRPFVFDEEPLPAEPKCQLQVWKNRGKRRYARTIDHVPNLHQVGNILSANFTHSMKKSYEPMNAAPLICEVHGQKVVQGIVKKYDSKRVMNCQSTGSKNCNSMFATAITFWNVAKYHKWIDRVLEALPNSFSF